MSSVGSVAAAERPEGGHRPEQVWADIELPGWEDFVGARERFFESLRRLERGATEHPRGRRRQDGGEDAPDRT